MITKVMENTNHLGRKIEHMDTPTLTIKTKKIVVPQQFSLDSMSLITTIMPITLSMKEREMEESTIN